ncbi:peptide deformylase [Malacoplasma penetrans]|uniref:Peptide deformylase n=1 Tax=Malacoplasma penetrans (strain HF-2) TaxID=272633 RepID=DEF_MALP2|nr:peptide deformylase [Malacoplasma penetrans]Q8EVJ8.1 RecName: Full=Peptide deformylase; Short=PDF; AltName: Full=Polypeptide deformylase [Malacoplasma penetrans HF-2]RXY96405.1 peptide deformylase [Malacoplasma penetrans]BAC44355.1 polypeptide deformylase [Malacoplasma penetrans HF-2]
MFKKLDPSPKWIVYDNNPVMHKPIEDVVFPLTKEDEHVISQMLSYVDASYEGEADKYDIRAGIGIAAIQLGCPKKIIYIHLDDKNGEHKYLMANPKIIKESTSKMYLKNGEGCLSVKKDHKGLSIRKSIVWVKGIDLFTNKEIEVKATDLLAACFQHEVDHNNNKFYYNRINESDPYYVEKNWEEI